jgi:hypothetical protein
MKIHAVLLGLILVGCRSESPGAREKRAMDNLARLEALEREHINPLHGAGFLPLAPFPSGRPWEHAVAAEPLERFHLMPGPDGRFYEQYSVTVDPEGMTAVVAGPVIDLSSGRVAPPVATQLIPRWCEITVVGRFASAGDRVVRRGLRLEVRMGDVPGLVKVELKDTVAIDHAPSPSEMRRREEEHAHVQNRLLLEGLRFFVPKDAGIGDAIGTARQR